jgi:carboxylesterase
MIAQRWLSLTGIIVVLVAGLILLLYAPLGTRDLVSVPRPTADYVEAMARLGILQAADGPEVTPKCRLQLLTHGRKVARSIVLLYGYTNCPQQFLPLGQQLHAQGYNVLIPRFPFHGY